MQLEREPLLPPPAAVQAPPIVKNYDPTGDQYHCLLVLLLSNFDAVYTLWL